MKEAVLSGHVQTFNSGQEDSSLSCSTSYTKNSQRLRQKQPYNLPQHISRFTKEYLQTIIFSKQGIEHTIIGIMTQVENYVYLYEYRGKQIGTEFFISFSQNSTSYKLIDVKEMASTD